MTDAVARPKPHEIADSLLEMAQDVEIGHADRFGVPAASFLRESADCISRQGGKIEMLRGALLQITAIIETQGEPDIDAMHDVAREALNR